MIVLDSDTLVLLAAGHARVVERLSSATETIFTDQFVAWAVCVSAHLARGGSGKPDNRAGSLPLNLDLVNVNLRLHSLGRYGELQSPRPTAR